jgi:hypothetical protein
VITILTTDVEGIDPIGMDISQWWPLLSILKTDVLASFKSNLQLSD